jgi:hypothetical protein
MNHGFHMMYTKGECRCDQCTEAFKRARKAPEISKPNTLPKDLNYEDIVLETGRSWEKKVALAIAYLKEIGEETGEIADMLGIGDGPEFAHDKTSYVLRKDIDGNQVKSRTKPKQLSARIRMVRLYALQMEWLAVRTHSGGV